MHPDGPPRGANLSARLKLACIVPSLAERHGGPSKSVRALAHHLAAAGESVELLATRVETDAPITPGEERATLRVFPRIWPEPIVRSPALAAYLAASDFDCVHHHSIWLRTLGYAAEAARHHGRPLVISPRGMMSPWAWRHHHFRKQVAARLLHPGAFRRAAGWHATSGQEADDIRALGFRQPICTAPNGVTLPSPADLAVAKAEWLAACPAAAGRPVALFYSRLHRKKRVRELIDLWLATPRGPWLLVIAGTAEEFSAAELAAEARQRGGDQSIVVLDGAGRPPPYALASLFVLPSHSENFGLVIAEALAAGVPVVVTDSTPWAELGGAGAGWCVPWTDYPTALAQALATPAAELAAMGARGRDLMQRRYSWAGAALTLRDFYRGLR